MRPKLIYFACTATTKSNAQLWHTVFADPNLLNVLPSVDTLLRSLNAPIMLAECQPLEQLAEAQKLSKSSTQT